MATLVPITIAGVGVREAGFIGFLGIYGISAADALAFSLTNFGLQLAIAAFLAGASLEDALRRLCDARRIEYDTEHTTISKLLAMLHQPSKQIEVISSSENQQILGWGHTRNHADHGRFGEITYAEVLAMVIGVRGFLDKHLP